MWYGCCRTTFSKSAERRTSARADTKQPSSVQSRSADHCGSISSILTSWKHFAFSLPSLPLPRRIAIQLELEMVYAPLASPASASSAPPPLKLIRLTSVTSSSSSRSFSFSTEFWRWFQCLAAPGDAQLTRVKSRATSAAAVKQKTD